MMAETPAIESVGPMMSGLGIAVEVLTATEVRERLPGAEHM